VAPSTGMPAEGGAPVPLVAPRDSFPETTSPRDQKVSVQELAVIDPNSTGVLDEQHGGLGRDMWAGTDIALVQKVLPLVTPTPTTRALRNLSRRLLLSIATVPAGKAGPESLIKLRADKLWAMGEVEGLNQLLKGLPAPAFTPELRRTAAEAALLAGDSQAACDQLPLLRGLLANDPLPPKLQVYCQYANNRAKDAALGVDLLREQKINDPAFFAAADAMAGLGNGKAEDFAQPSPVALALARLAKMALPETAAAGASSPAVLRTIAVSPGATLEARLLAAEKAEAVGALDTDLLRQTYEAVTFTPQELAAPIGQDKGPRGRAFLYRAAVQQVLPTAKAEIITKALSLAPEGSPAYFAAARLYGPQLVGLKPAPELLGFAPVAARALLAGNRFEAARGWINFLRGQSTLSTEAAAAASALWPLARLSGPEDDRPPSAALLAAWHKVRADQPGEASVRRTTLCYSLLAALGDKVPSEVWLPLYDGPTLVQATIARPALWLGLRRATEDLRLGETVLLSLATLGEASPVSVDPTDVYRVVAALRLLGLDADARALAVELAIANGV